MSRQRQFLRATCLSGAAFLLLLISARSQSLETIIQQGHELAVVSVAISADSNYVLSGSRDKSAKLWEYRSGREVRSFLGHEATVRAVAFTNDGTAVLTGSNDNTIRIWSIADGSVRMQLKMPEIVTSVAVDPMSRFYVAGGYSDSVVVFDGSGKVLKRLPASPDKGMGSGVDLSISPKGNYLAISEDNRVVNLYRTTDWMLVRSRSWNGCEAKGGLAS